MVPRATPSAPASHGGVQVLKVAGAPFQDDGHVDQGSHAGEQVQVHAQAGALPVDRGQADFPGAEGHAPADPVHGIGQGFFMPVIVQSRGSAVIGDVDAELHGLGAVHSRQAGNQVRVVEGGRSEAELVGARVHAVPGVS